MKKAILFCCFGIATLIVICTGIAAEKKVGLESNLSWEQVAEDVNSKSQPLYERHVGEYVTWSGYVSRRFDKLYSYAIKTENPAVELYQSKPLAHATTHLLTDVAVNLHFGAGGKSEALKLQDMSFVRFRGRINNFASYGGGPSVNLIDVEIIEVVDEHDIK